MGITEELANYIAGARFEDLPPNVVRIAKRMVLDDIGCAFGGLSAHEAEIFREYVKDIGGKPEVTIVGAGSKVPAVHGAGVNTFFSNMLDFDTAHRNYTITGSVPVWTAIAMAERQDATGKDVITALVTAYDIHNRIGDAMIASLEFRARCNNMGYQAFGSMTAAVKILSLDAAAICDAIGIAGYTAPLVNLNLWMKGVPSSPIKGAVYWQCKRGIQAALLAQRGFMGPPGLLDKKEWGYWAGVSDRCDWDMITQKLGEEYYVEKYLCFKPWSCCRCNHHGIQMLLEILDKEKIDPMDVEEVVFKEHATLVSWVTFHVQMPEDEFGSMYSIPYALATMALGYEPGSDWFSDERRNDPRVKELAEKIRLEEDPEITRVHEANPEKSFSKLELKIKGKVYKTQMEDCKGDPQKPMTQEEIEGKFRSMARRVISDKQAERIIDIINNLDELDNIKELTREFVGPA
ncbi:MmgE/PrpD family protein [Chloroflexota bacterium]